MILQGSAIRFGKSPRWAISLGAAVVTALTVAGCGGVGGGNSGGGGSTSTITSVAASCAASTVKVGQTAQCSATVTGTGTFSQAVTWSVQNVAGGNSTIGTISSSGLFTAPATVPNPALLTVTATSQQDGSKVSSASITVQLSIALSSSASSVTVYRSVQFTPTVTGVANTSVSWAVNGIAGGDLTVGQIDGAGLYTAPNQVPSPTAVTISATSVADTTQSASATLTIVGDITAPTVISTVPINGATGVTISPMITALFNEGMDPSSINPTTVTLSDNANILPATVDYDPSSFTVSVHPTGVLSIGKTYTVAIGSPVSDLAGNSLGSAFVWSFTVEGPVTVGATLSAPSGLDPTALTAISFGGKESSLDSAGNFSANIRPEGISLIVTMIPNKAFGLMAFSIPPSQSYALVAQHSGSQVIREGQLSKGTMKRSNRWQITASPSASANPSNLSIDFQTTAESLLFMTPYLFHSDPSQAEAIMAIIAADPNTSVLATALSSSLTEANPLSNSAVQSSIQNALASIVTTLSNSSVASLTQLDPKSNSLRSGASVGILASTTSSTLHPSWTPNCWSSPNHIQPESRLQCEDLDYISLSFSGSSNPPGGYVFTPNNQSCPFDQWGLGCSVSWLVRVVPIQSAMLPPGGVDSITPGSGSFGPYSPIGNFDPPACGLGDHTGCEGFLFLPGQSSFQYLDVVKDALQAYSNWAGISSQQTVPTFQVPSNSEQVYLLRAYSGGLADSAELDNVISGQYSNGQALWAGALIENVAESGIQLLSAAGVLSDSLKSCTLKHVSDLATLQDLQLQILNSPPDGATSLQTFYEFAFDQFLSAAADAATTCGGSDSAVQGLLTYLGAAGKWIGAGSNWISDLQSVSTAGEAVQRLVELGVEASPVETAFISIYNPSAAPARLQISCPSSTMSPGQSQQCSAKAFDALGNAISTGQSSFVWATDTSLLRVNTSDGSGLLAQVTALRPGSATLTVSAMRPPNGPNVQASTKLSIAGPTLAKLVLSPATMSVPAGQSYELIAQGFDSNNHAVGLTNVIWSTSNSSAATISTSSGTSWVGILNSVAVGSATITATSAGVQGKASVNVTPASTGGTSIALGQVINGTLSASAPVGHCNYGAPSDRYFLDLSAQSGSTSITVAGSSTAFDSFVCLLDASNNLIAQDDDSSGNLNSLATVSLAPGRYFIEISSFGAAGSGSYTLSAATPAISVPGVISAGARSFAILSSSAAKGQCNGLAPADRWMFTLSTTTTVTINLSSTAFDTYACLLNSSNFAIAQDDNSGSGTNSRAIYQNLSAGTYYIEVSSRSNGNAGGAYTLSLQQGLPPGKPLSVGSSVPGGLQGTAAKGQCNGLAPADRWMFTVPTTTTVTIDLSSTSFDTYVCLLNSSNFAIAQDDNSGSGTNSRAIYQNLSAGTYYIEVSSRSSGNAGGAYTLSLQQGLPPGTPISVGSTGTGNLTTLAAKGQCNGLVPADRWMFTVPTTTTVTIDLSSTSFDTYVCLLNSSNFAIAQDDNSGGGTNSKIVTTLNASTYYIEVSSRSSTGGAYTLGLH